MRDRFRRLRARFGTVTENLKIRLMRGTGVYDVVHGIGEPTLCGAELYDHRGLQDMGS